MKIKSIVGTSSRVVAEAILSTEEAPKKVFFDITDVIAAHDTNEGYLALAISSGAANDLVELRVKGSVDEFVQFLLDTIDAQAEARKEETAKNLAEIARMQAAEAKKEEAKE